MVPRVVIDTNVVVSALLFGGTPGKVIPIWKNGSIRPFTSKAIIQEYLRVFAYPKFELTEKEITYLLYQEIMPYFDVINVTAEMTYVPMDPTDDKFVLCALEADADNIISGDTHLLSLKKIGNTIVITPSQLLDLLAS